MTGDLVNFDFLFPELCDEFYTDEILMKCICRRNCLTWLFFDSFSVFLAFGLQL